MRTKFSVFVAAVFFMAAAVAFIAPPGHAFWYGTLEGLTTEYLEEGIPPGPFDPPGTPNSPPMAQEDQAELHSLLLDYMDYVLPGGGPGGGNQYSYGQDGVTIYKPHKAQKGFTLLSSLTGGCDRNIPVEDQPENCSQNGAILIDMHGNVVKTWPLRAFPVKMLPNGDVIGSTGYFEEVLAQEKMVQMDWKGNSKTLWDRSTPYKEDGTFKEGVWYTEDADAWCRPYPPGHPLFPGCYPLPYNGGFLNAEGIPVVSGWHHDFQVEGNPVGYWAPGHRAKKDGEILILANYAPPKAQTDGTLDEDCVEYSRGYSPFNGCYNISSDMRLYGEVIYELDNKGNIKWSWYAFEHFEAGRWSDTDMGMGFSDTAKDAIHHFNGNNIAWIGENCNDYQHFNNINRLGPNKWWSKYGDWRFHPDNIIFDARSNNIMGIIARHDGGGYSEGDVVWRLGPTYTPGEPGWELGTLIGMHHAHMIPKGLPGAGDILVFDNGGNAGFGPLLPGLEGTYPNTFRDFSRVIQFNPITLKKTWEYHKVTWADDPGDDGLWTGNERKFNSIFISGAQRLPNGNTLITSGAEARVFEVTPKGEVVWDYHSPYAGLMLGQFPGNFVYRAYRVPKHWVMKQLKQQRRH